MAFQKLEAAFVRYIGASCMEGLQSKVPNERVKGVGGRTQINNLKMSDRPAILLGGDQLTGKSTMSAKLANNFPGV
jgi:hypothetical protein